MKCALLSAAFGLALLPAAVFADTTWNGNADGDFNNADNWSDGVPTTTNAGVIDKTGDNTILVSASPSEKVGALSLKNNASGSTTLSVTAPMQFEGGYVSIDRNSEVVVGAGGEWNQDFTGAAANGGTLTFSLYNGGKFTVNGGLAAFTNTTGRLVVGGDNEGNTGTIDVESGRFLHARTSGDGMRLYTNGVIKIAGDGVFETATPEEIAGFGGTIDLSGNGQMLVTKNPANGYPFYLLSRALNVRMSGNASIRNYALKTLNEQGTAWRSPRWQITSLGSDDACCVEMSDNAFIDVYGGRQHTDSEGKTQTCAAERLDIGIGNNQSPYGRMPTVVKMRGNSRLYSPSRIYVGFGAGSNGVLDIGDDAALEQYEKLSGAKGGYSLGISFGGQSTSTSVPSQGTLRMSGGRAIVYRSLRANDQTKTWEMSGFLVGDGTNGDYDGAVAIGLVEMSGGVITNQGVSAFALGARSAKGTLVQSGGLISTAHDAHLPVLIGFSGGEGLYDMSGGEFDGGARTVYVGGATITDAGYDATCNQYKGWADRLATGTLVVSGGVFRTTGSMYVSSHGYGTLEIGKAGRIEAANLYLTNSTVNDVTAPATLKVKLGPAGCGTVDLSGVCQIAADARCEIDVSEFTPAEDGQTISFLECASVEGGFAAANVSVTGPGRSSYRLVATETGLSVKCNPVGLMIFVR